MRLAIDTETTGSRWREGDAPYYISTCDEEGNLKCWRFQVDPVTRITLAPRKKIKEVLDYFNQYSTFVFHNAKFDLAALQAIGIDLTDRKITDTIFRAHIIDNRMSRKLKDLSKLYLGMDDDDEADLLRCVKAARNFLKKEHDGKLKKLRVWKYIPGDDADDGEDGEHWMKVDAWIPGQLALIPEVWEYLPTEQVLSWTQCLERYGTRDAERTMALEILFTQYMESMPDSDKALQFQLDALPAFMDLEKYGVSLLTDAHGDAIEHHLNRSDQLIEDMTELTGIEEFNPRSTLDVRTALFENYEFPILEVTPKNVPSTNEGILQELLPHSKSPEAEKFLKKLLAYRKNDMMLRYLGSYEDYRIGSRLYSSFNMVGTDTTRSSSSRPNMQNIGKGEEYDGDKAETLGEVAEDDYLLRRVFGPGKGRIWLDYDYDQLQLRIFAFMSQDPKLIKAFEDGWDAHNYMACQIYGVEKPTKLQRRTAKNVNFGFIFGAQEKKITATCGDASIWPKVNQLFPDAVKYLERVKREVKKTGKVTVMGYPLQVPINPVTKEVKAYTGVVYGVQGMEGLIVKRAMKLCRDYLSSLETLPNQKLPEGFISLLVHDELVFDLRKPKDLQDLKPHAAKLKECMEQAGRDCGIVTPASGSLVLTSWDEGIEEW